jgi:hypothetical protein
VSKEIVSEAENQGLYEELRERQAVTGVGNDEGALLANSSFTPQQVMYVCMHVYVCMYVCMYVRCDWCGQRWGSAAG